MQWRWCSLLGIALSCPVGCTPAPPEAPGHRAARPNLAAPKPVGRPPTAESVAAHEAETRTGATPAREPTGEFASLPTDYGQVVVWVPNASEPRPLLLAAHGAGGAPEWHCAFWAERVRAAAFVVCPRGRPYDHSGAAFYFPQHHDLDARIQSALQAFEASYRERWTGRHSVYVGYSQGATMGAYLLPTRGSEFEFALLVEGGYQQWPVKNAREFQASGGRRAFFACGTDACTRGATRSMRWLQMGGVEARLSTAPGAGHTPAGAVGEIARDALGWLVRDAPGWQALASNENEPD